MGSARQSQGFTLIEMMIVVAMIAIIATIALGSYRDSTVRANRSAAASYILEVANLQERYLLDNRDYAPNMVTLGASAPPEVSNNYTVTISDPGGAAPAYLISAAPKGAQASDDTACGTLTLDNLGTKGDAGGARCWR